MRYAVVWWAGFTLLLAPIVVPSASVLMASDCDSHDFGKKPELAPDYSAMIGFLVERLRTETFVMLPADGRVQQPESRSKGLPAEYRPPTSEEEERMRAVWPKVAPENNAAYYYVKAMKALADSDCAPAGAGIAYYRKPYEGDVAALGKWAEVNQQAVDSAREGLKQTVYCPPMCVIADGSGCCVPPSFFSGVRQLGNAWTDAGFVEELKGNSDLAARTYLECIRFGKTFLNSGLAEALLGKSIQVMGWDMLDRLLASATLRDETLLEVIKECRGAEITQANLENDYMAVSEYAKALIALTKASLRDDSQFALVFGRAKALKEIVTQKSLNELLQNRVLDTLYAGELKQFADQKAETQAFFREWGHMLVYLRVTQIRAGLILYQRQHGTALPDTLDTLCPVILPSVPMDPFSGAPMRYEKKGSGWKIWSVGEDNVDNGGQGQRGIPIWNEPDAVFFSDIRSNVEVRSKGKVKP